jgi:hypothetical protein
MTNQIRIVSSPNEAKATVDARFVYSPEHVRGERYIVRSEPPKAEEEDHDT